MEPEGNDTWRLKTLLMVVAMDFVVDYVVVVVVVDFNVVVVVIDVNVVVVVVDVVAIVVICKVMVKLGVLWFLMLLFLLTS